MVRQVTQILLDDGTVHSDDSGCSIPVDTQGLIAFYPAEGQGRYLIDESSNGHDGIIVGGARASGITGQSLELKPSDFVSVDSRIAFEFATRPFAIFIFINPNSTGSGQLIGKMNEQAGFRIFLNSGEIHVELKSSAGGKRLESATRLQTNDWHSICVSRKTGGKTSLYIDGIPEDDDVAEYDLSNGSRLLLGGNQNKSADFRLDEIYFYDRHLDDDEVMNLHKIHTI